MKRTATGAINLATIAVVLLIVALLIWIAPHVHIHG